MMIDFALDAERNEGKAPREAIFQASLLRFRPILMTTLSALLGALPLMLGGGVGSELRHPLGITMVGGLIVSQVAHAVHDSCDLPRLRPPGAARRGEESAARGEYANMTKAGKLFTTETTEAILFMQTTAESHKILSPWSPW